MKSLRSERRFAEIAGPCSSKCSVLKRAGLPNPSTSFFRPKYLPSISKIKSAERSKNQEENMAEKERADWEGRGAVNLRSLQIREDGDYWAEN